MNELSPLIKEYLLKIGVNDEENILNLTIAILTLSSILGLFVIDFISKRIIRIVFTRLAKKSKTRFDDILITNRTPKYIAHILPFTISLYIIPEIFNDTNLLEMLLKLNKVVIALVLVFLIRSVIHTIRDYIKTLPSLKDKPIDSYIQVIMMFVWTITIISMLAIVTGRSFMEFITTIGAASAIIILVFKDTIMGFVASIQVSVNDMVRIGDWITFQKYGADGDVIEINLATVKVQNFDMTITTIPTYALISRNNSLEIKIHKRSN